MRTGGFDSFVTWARDAEPRVRQALTAGFGPQVGRDATADAFAHAWEHWSDVETKANPVGYVFGVGRNLARQASRRRPLVFPDVQPHRMPDVEPGLPAALAGLPERQRVVVTLLHGYDWTMKEVAELLGIEKTSVQNHAERGLSRLRQDLGVSNVR